LTFNGLRGAISQKIELFITTAVRTSNLQEKRKKIWDEEQGKGKKRTMRGNKGIGSGKERGDREY
jgi:hypothetical protein